MTQEKTGMNETQTKISIAMRAKVGVCWLQSVEETRVQRAVIEVVDGLEYETLIWTATRGMVKADAGIEELGSAATRDPVKAIEQVLAMEGRTCLLMLDLASWLNDPMTLRTVKDAHLRLPTCTKDRAKQIVVIDNATPPVGLVGVTQIEWPLPDRDTMSEVVDAFCKWMPAEAVTHLRTNGNKDKLISAMLGLTTEDAASALARSLAANSTLDPQIVAQEKERVVKGSGLEWYDPDPRGLDGVGGMNELKDWLAERKSGFTQAAREYGLPAPRGVMLLGVPGCGKSLTAKAIATAWGLPLLRMDIGALFSKFVGESEGKIRAALQTAETVAPCILWMDEIEKAFASGGETDGGTSSRVFGTFLTWMQERKEGVFIVATSNDISKLPPEFLRAGRWDDIWFVDLPNGGERQAIVEVMKRKYANTDKVVASMVATASADNTGAEIEQAFVEAMFAAFSDKGRGVTTKDVVAALGARVPLAVTMKEKIADLQKWAKGRARLASTADTTQAKRTGRDIE